MLEKIETIPLRTDPLLPMFREQVLGKGRAVPAEARLYTGKLPQYVAAHHGENFQGMKEFCEGGAAEAEGFVFASAGGYTWQGFWERLGLVKPPCHISADETAEVMIISDHTQNVDINLRDIVLKTSGVDMEWDVVRSNLQQGEDHMKSAYVVVTFPRFGAVSMKYNYYGPGDDVPPAPILSL